METVEKQSLDVRTRQRSNLTWLTLNSGGILGPLVPLEAEMDILARPTIENFMAISEEAWGIKEQQRDESIEVSQAEVDQDRKIAEDKIATGRSKIAIDRTADEYTLAAKVYDVRVKGLIMAVKEYAALVEREQLANDKARAGLAVDKEELRRLKIKAEIYLEDIQKAQVEVDLVRSQVDVAKAHVRAAMAGIEAGRAEIEVIEAEIQKFLAEGEKATLQADVATIYAEIMTKKLSEIRLGVGQAEIAAQYGFIQSKLEDTLTLYDTRNLIEAIRTEAEVAIKEELDLVLAVEKADQDLRNLEADYNRFIFEHEKTETAINIQQEEIMRQALVEARKALNQAQLSLTTQREQAQTQAAAAVAAATKLVHAMTERTALTWEYQTEYISG